MTPKEAIAGEITRLEERATQLRVLAGLLDTDPVCPAIDLAFRIWQDEQKAWRWLCEPNIFLDDATPLAAVLKGRGARVERVLNALDYGVAL